MTVNYFKCSKLAKPPRFLQHFITAYLNIFGKNNYIKYYQIYNELILAPPKIVTEIISIWKRSQIYIAPYWHDKDNSPKFYKILQESFNKDINLTHLCAPPGSSLASEL